MLPASVDGFWYIQSLEGYDLSVRAQELDKVLEIMGIWQENTWWLRPVAMLFIQWKRTFSLLALKGDIELSSVGARKPFWIELKSGPEGHWSLINTWEA